MSLCLFVLLPTQSQAGPIGSFSAQMKGYSSRLVPLEPLGSGLSISVPERLSRKERKPFLEGLYRRLRQASSQTLAQPIADAIEQVWLTSGDDNIDFIMQNAILAMEQRDFVVAEELLDRVIELMPFYAEGWNKRAMVHFMKKEYEKTLETLRHALALDPKHFQALHGLALTLQEIGDRSCALQAYRVLLRNHPQFVQAKEAIKELDRQVNGQDT
ncbi:MAG: hypothetical protein L3J67_12850 [Hyphomicrobiaceae bacterium]|nr:hypothetical protein [Hyphomicrobiaceae bacterium]